MPNGRGQIDCSYCLHWFIDEVEWGYASGQYDGHCTCWDVDISRSLTDDHKFCLDFTPSKYYGEDNAVGHPDQKLSAEEVAQEVLNAYLQIKPDMKIGMLYHGGFVGSGDCEIIELMSLDEQPEPG